MHLGKDAADIKTFGTDRYCFWSSGVYLRPCSLTVAIDSSSLCGDGMQKIEYKFGGVTDIGQASKLQHSFTWSTYDASFLLKVG